MGGFKNLLADLEDIEDIIDEVVDQAEIDRIIKEEKRRRAEAEYWRIYAQSHTAETAHQDEDGLLDELDEMDGFELELDPWFFPPDPEKKKELKCECGSGSEIKGNHHYDYCKLYKKD